jgi:hypothetical protein
MGDEAKGLMKVLLYYPLVRPKTPKPIAAVHLSSGKMLEVGQEQRMHPGSRARRRPRPRRIGEPAAVGSHSHCWRHHGHVIDPFQILLAPALFDCFREETRLMLLTRGPRVRGPRRNCGRGL